MDERIREAVSLFEEVLIYGTERVIRSVDDPIWKEYSPEQIQLLKLIYKEGEITSGRLAVLQGVHKSAISNRLKKLMEKELIDTKPSGDKREKILVLTSLGEEVVNESDRVLHEYIGKLMSNQVDDEEIDQFLVTFRKLREILKMNGV
ncbi:MULTISPECIES: MarR family winged helix-turn-helix transcriptional regulator [Paenisporosarcina]|uniref:MarR family transcriptional regulator n=1 Tax=Paenisporosarcina quisquiliarum TaxID=365346 RepID=A0A9X3LH59_9BACL|nr:MarR family transcriptional regulator [Paenisporosarcina quisquiliarum]MCZ8537612.1 MarR family transcriptional regulator [Paenisporosarcina quisquiliarum]